MQVNGHQGFILLAPKMNQVYSADFDALLLVRLLVKLVLVLNKVVIY
jgi:hypothetical protein